MSDLHELLKCDIFKNYSSRHHGLELLHCQLTVNLNSWSFSYIIDRETFAHFKHSSLNLQNIPFKIRVVLHEVLKDLTA